MGINCPGARIVPDEVDGGFVIDADSRPSEDPSTRPVEFVNGSLKCPPLDHGFCTAVRDEGYILGQFKNSRVDQSGETKLVSPKGLEFEELDGMRGPKRDLKAFSLQNGCVPELPRGRVEATMYVPWTRESGKKIDWTIEGVFARVRCQCPYLKEVKS